MILQTETKLSSIGIFDSGVGGLGIFEQIARALPNENIVYLGDTKNFPYGKKSIGELHTLTKKILDFMITEHNIKMAVVACNTATTTSLDYLRNEFAIPIVGAVPVVKPACQLSKNKRVAILATETTVNSDYHKNLVATFGLGVEVISVGCPELVRLVELGQLETPETLSWLKHYLEPVIQSGADVVGLGCTHFPFLMSQIKEIVGPEVVILDSNEPVANQAVKVFQRLQLSHIASDKVSAKYNFYATKDAVAFQNLVQKLLPLKQLIQVDLAIF